MTKETLKIVQTYSVVEVRWNDKEIKRNGKYLPCLHVTSYSKKEAEDMCRGLAEQLGWKIDELHDLPIIHRKEDEGETVVVDTKPLEKIDRVMKSVKVELGLK